MKRCVPTLIAVVLLLMSTTAFGQHFEFVQTDVNASNLILAATINDESLVEGDEVGVFTPNGLCAGAGVIPAGFPNNALGVAGWGTEQGQNNGFADNDVIEYRFWSQEIGEEIVADGLEFIAGDGHWVANGMNVVLLSAQHEDQPVPVIAVDPENIDFGAVLVGEQAVEVLTITNIGEEVLNVDDFDVTNIDGEAFSFDIEIPEFPWEFVQTDNNMSVLALTSTLNGDPLAAGDYIGTFTPAGLCAGFYQVENEGDAVGVPAWGAEQGQNNGFRAGESIECRYWISDVGREYVADIEIVVGENSYAANTMLVANLTAGDGFNPAVGGFALEPGESFEVGVLFAPDAAGEFTGEIVISSDDPENPEVVVPLIGMGGAQEPEISLDVEGFDFGSILIGEFADWTFTISNVGGGDLTVESAAVSGAYFSGDGEDGFVIPAGESRDVTVTFAPEEAGDFNGEVTITSDDPNNAEIILGLMGVGEPIPAPDIVADPDAIDFGVVVLPLGEDEPEIVEEVITISNVGDAALTVLEAVVAGDGFSIDIDLSGGGEQFDWEYVQTDANMSVLVQSATIDGEPLQPGDYIGTFTEAGLCGGFYEVTDVGAQVGVPAWGAEQGQQNGFRDGEAIEMRFFDIDPGREYVAEYAEIIAGEPAFTGNGLLVCHLAAGNGFMPAEVVLNPGESVQGTVFFSPVAEGEHNGTITISSDDPDGDLVVALTGIGAFQAADIAVNSEGHDFGAVMVSESADWAFEISNVGGNDLTVENIVVAGDGFTTDFGEGFVLASGESREVNVTFEPADAGDFEGSVTIFSDDEDESEVAIWLAGAGELLPPEIAVDAQGYDFGTVEVGEMADWSFNIANVGVSDLNVESVVVEGDYFSVDVEGGFALASGENVDVTVTFAPEAEGEFDATVIITSDDPDDGVIEVALTGIGELTAVPAIAVNSDIIDFGGVLVGEDGEDLLVISNEGNAALTIFDVTLEGEGFDIDVDINGGFREFPWEYVQTDNNMSTLIQSVEFNGEPLDVGNYVGVFTENGTCAGFGVVEEAGGAMGVPAWGAEQGQQNGFAANEAIEFRYWESDPGREYVADVDLISGEAIYVANGLVVCTLSAGHGNMPAELVLEAGETLEVPVFFMPEAIGDYEGWITITSNDPDNDAVMVQLLGVGELPPPEIAVDAQGYDFGTVEVGEMADWSFNIANVGVSDLNVESVVVEGDYFSVDVEGGFALASGENVDVTVTFAPEAEGEFDATVIITSDDPDDGVIEVALTGIGELTAVPAIAVNSDIIDFGGVLVGEDGEDLLVISNEGNAALTIFDVTLEGEGFDIDVDINGGFREFPWEYVQTDNNMSTLIQSVEFNGEPLDVGNYVGVFTENGTCAGFGVVEEAGGAMGVPAWGAEQGQQNGFAANEAIEFRYWESDPGREYVADVDLISGEAIYVANGLVVCTLSAGHGNMPAELVLEAGETLEVPVFFNPDAEGDYEGWITITSNDPDNDAVMVQLLGVGEVVEIDQWIGFQPEAVEFAPVLVGEQGEETLTIFNSSEDQDLNITDLVIDNDVFSLDPGIIEGEFNWEFAQTDNNMSIIVQDASVDGEQLVAGDYVGVFTQAGLCAGFSVIPESLFDNGGVGVSAWGAEQGVQNGFANQGHIHFRIWDTDAGRQFVAQPEVGFGEPIYVANGFLVLSDLNAGRGMQPADLAIEPGGSIEIQIYFDPEEPMEYNGTLTVFSNDPTVPEAVVTLTGNGELPEADINVSDAAYDFEDVHVGDSNDWAFSITNVGGSDLTVESVVTDGDGFVDDIDEGFVLASGASQYVTVTFTPDAPGDFVGTVTITSDDEDEAEVVVDLMGFGYLNPPVITLSAEGYDFGELYVGDDDSWGFEIGNEGETDLEVDISIQGNYFTLDAEGGFSLEPGARYEAIVTFAPEDAGQFEGEIMIRSNDPEAAGVVVAVTGSAVWFPLITLTPDDVIDFGTLYIDETGEGELSIANPGGAALTVSGVIVEGEYFFIDGFEETVIDAGASMDLPVFFAPENAGDFGGMLTVVSNARDMGEVSVNLVGVGELRPADIDVSVGEIDFERVHVGDPESLAFTISNVGGIELVIESIITVGDGFADDVEEGFVLAAGASQDVMVTFAPDAPGDYAGTVTIISNDEDEGEVVVDLMGIGYLNPPVITLSEEGHDFGELYVGDSGDWSFEIGNDGELNLDVEAITVDGDYFTIDEEGGFSLEPGEFAEVMVTYAPEDAGQFAGVITVFSNDLEAAEVMVNVIGSAVHFPLIALDPDDLINFGTVYVDDTGESVLNISNPGGSPLTISDIVVDGAYFYIEEDEDEFRDFDWEYVQTDMNMSILVMEATIDGESLVEGDVIGAFTDGGLCAGYGRVHGNFPNQAIGFPAWGAEQDQHNGFAADAPINFRLWDIDAGREYSANAELLNMNEVIWQPNGFMVVNLESDRPMMNFNIQDIVIGPDDSIDLPVFFTPEDEGEFNGTLTIISNARDMEEVSVDLFGIGEFRIELILTGDAYDFGEMYVGESGEWVLGVENAGQADLVIESIDIEGAYFSMDVNDGFVLGVGESVGIHVVFAPEDGGQFDGTITIVSNDPDNDGVSTVSLTGSAIWFPIIRIEPDDQIDFGAIPIETETMELLHIFNDGRAPLTVDQILIDGEGFSLGAFQQEEPGEFYWEYTQTDANMSVLIMEATLDGQSLVEGDVIGVFTEEGLCGGYGAIPAGFPGDDAVGIPAWGAEQVEGQDQNNGFHNGDLILYRFWDTEAGREYEADVRYIEGDGNWALNALFVATLSAHRGNAPQNIAEIIAPGSFADVEVFFRPDQPRGYEGSITVISNDRENGELNIGLIGSGYIPPTITFTEVSYEFDQLLVGEDASWQFTVGNDGDVNLEVESVTIAGAFFSVAPDEAFVIGPDEVQEFNVTFAPEDAGDFEGSITFVSNDPHNGEAVVELAGSAIWFPIIALDPNEVVDFGEMYDGGQADGVVVIHNEGLAALTTDDIVVDGHGFRISDEVEVGQVIQPGEFYEVPVMFLPDDAGEFNGTLTVWSDDPYNPVVSVALLGNGYFLPPEIEVSVEAIDFGGVVVGDIPTIEFTIFNSGQLPLVVDAIITDGQYFAANQEGGVEIGRDGELVVEVTFAPEFRGDYAGTITIISNDDETPEVIVALSGIGLAPIIDVDPMAVDFGRVYIDEEDSQEIMLRNDGDAELIINDLVLDNDAYSFIPPEGGGFDWEFVQSDNGMSVLVLDGHIGGRQLAAGDVIGAFTDAGICGGYDVVPENVFEEGVGLAVWGDEAGGEITGFRAGETLNYRIWDESANREWEAVAQYNEGDDFFATNGFSVVTLTAGDAFNPAELDEPIVLEPGASTTIVLFFRPLDGIEYPATLTVLNNDPESPEVVVEINGEGRFHNQPPTWVDVPAEIEADENSLFEMLFVADDFEDDPLTIEFADLMGNLPDEATFTDNNDGTGLFSWEIDFESAGNYGFGLTVIDDHNNEASVEVSLTVNNVNRAPVFVNPVPTVETFEVVQVEIFMESMDPDGNDLTMGYDFEYDVDEFVDHDDGSCTFMWTPDYEAAGDHVVTFTSSDGDSTTSFEVTITVIDVNRTPMVEESIGRFEVLEDADRTAIADLDDVFSDPDRDILTYSVENLNELDHLNLEIDGDNVLSVQPAADYNGESDVILIADDGREQLLMLAPMRIGNNAVAFSANPVASRSVRSINNTPAAGPSRDDSVSDQFTLVVIPVNDAPFLSEPVADITVDEDSGVITVDLAGVFGDIDDQDLTFNLVAAPAQLNGSVNGDQLTFDPDENFNLPDGAEITVSAEDAEGLMAEDVFVLTINPVNDAPVVAAPIGDLVFDEDPGLVILDDLNHVFADVDGDDLDFAFTTDSEGLNMGLDNNFILFINPDEDFTTPDAPVTVVLTATDRQLDVEYTFTISIEPINDPPVAIDEINDVTVDEDSQLIQVNDLDDFFFDIDGQRLTYEFSGAPDELNMGIDEENILFFQADANYNLPDGVEITITAIDPFGLTATLGFRLTIRPINDAPEWVVFPEPITAEEGDVIEFNIVAEDIDSQELTIGWANAGGVPAQSLTDNHDGTASFIWETSFNNAGEYNPTIIVTDGQLVDILSISITITDVHQLIHFVDFIETNDFHPVVIFDVALAGETVPTYWEVGVFTPGGLLSGAVYWDAEEGSVGVAVWGDDPDTDPVEGFVIDEMMTFMIWDFENDVEYEATPELVNDGGLNWSPNGFTQLNLNAEVERDLVVDLRANWNFTSLNIIPNQNWWRNVNDAGPDIVLMLQQFVVDGTHQVLLIKNDRGRFYHPPSGFKNFTYWDLGEGYSIRMASARRGTWTGSPIPWDTPLSVGNGWNYVPYYPDYTLNARGPAFYVLSPIIGNVLLAKNGTGQFMAPRVRFSNMPPWVQGQGYQVKMELNQIIQFSYPENPQRLAMLGNDETEMGTHFAEPEYTGENMSVLISSINDISVDVNDQIVAYSTDGKLVGSGMVEEDGRCGIAVWGTDQTSEEVNGLLTGEAFELRLWDADRGVEVGLLPIAILEGTGLTYETDGFVMLDLGVKPDVPESCFLSKAYPNPFNSTTRLTYGMTDAGHASLNVFDLNGRLVANLVDGTVNAGYHNVTWGGADLAAGVYMVQFEAAGFKSVSKVVLMK